MNYLNNIEKIIQYENETINMTFKITSHYLIKTYEP